MGFIWGRRSTARLLDASLVRLTLDNTRSNIMSRNISHNNCSYCRIEIERVKIISTLRASSISAPYRAARPSARSLAPIQNGHIFAAVRGQRVHSSRCNLCSYSRSSTIIFAVRSNINIFFLRLRDWVIFALQHVFSCSGFAAATRLSLQ